MAWSANMQGLSILYEAQFYKATRLPQETYYMFSQCNRWSAAYLVLYPFEFMCLIAAKLIVFDRVIDLAPPGVDDVQRRLVAAGRWLLGLVLFGNLICAVSNIAAAVQLVQVADFDSGAAAAYAANNTVAANGFATQANQKNQELDQTASAGLFAEVGVLLLVIAAFLVIGVMFFRFIGAILRDLQRAVNGDWLATARLDLHATLRSDDENKRLAAAAAAKGRHLRRQVLVTVAVVFVSFLMRATSTTINALARALQNSAADCPDTARCSLSCHNVYSLMLIWGLFRPEFSLWIILLSSPIALLVALWGMTNKRMLELMNAPPVTAQMMT